MHKVRSVFFYIMWFTWTILIGILGIPLLLTLRYNLIILVLFAWARVTMYMLRFICGLRYKIHGLANIPKDNYIVACKHQSAWETVFLYLIIKRPVFVLKKELLYIPIYGWYIYLLNMIVVKRADALKSMKIVLQGVRHRVTNGFNVIIFPEGTRTALNKNITLKPGIYAMHKSVSDKNVLPIALDSGKYWGGRGSWLISPGVVNVRVHSAIQFDNNKEVYLRLLHSKINEL